MAKDTLGRVWYDAKHVKRSGLRVFLPQCFATLCDPHSSLTAFGRGNYIGFR